MNESFCSETEFVGHVVPPLPNLQRVTHYVGWTKRQRAQQILTTPCWTHHSRSFVQPAMCPTKPKLNALDSTFPQNQQGLTLLEISIVVLILAITAAVALPNLSTTVPYRLDNAARELAEAIRFARAEAIRTGEARGISYTALSQTLSLYRDDSTPVYDIHHPIDKKRYPLDYSSDGNQAQVQLSSVTFKYGGNATNRESLSFD